MLTFQYLGKFCGSDNRQLHGMSGDVLADSHCIQTDHTTLTTNILTPQRHAWDSAAARKQQVITHSVSATSR